MKPAVDERLHATARPCRWRGTPAPRSRAPPVRSRARVTQGVVTPNIVAATSGRPSASCGSAQATMPAIAAAALARIRARDRVDAGDVRDRRHHRHVRPADVVARLARGHRRDHQLRHPDRQRAHRRRGDRRVRPTRRPRAPHGCRPSPYRRRVSAAAAPAIAAIAAPRSPAAPSAATSTRRLGADLLARDVGRPRRRLERPDVASSASTPAWRRRSRRKPSSSPLVSSVPTSRTVRAPSSVGDRLTPALLRGPQHRVADLGGPVAVLEGRAVRRRRLRRRGWRRGGGAARGRRCAPSR